MAKGPASCAAPAELWRIGRGTSPLRAHPVDPADLPGAAAGNRFDSPTGEYGVLYFGSDLDACFGETLSRFRPSAAVIAVVGEEWERLGYMRIGAVPAEWRARRSAVRVRPRRDDVFLDVEHPATHHHLTRVLAPGLAALGYDRLDVSVVRGADRRVTRMIGQWAFHAWESDPAMPVYAGIRYLSKLDTGWECWAVFDDTELEPCETKPITLDMPALRRVAERFELVVF